jgi:hypothetical protein
VKRLLVFSLVVAMLCFGGLIAFGLGESPPTVNSIEMIAMNPTAQIPVTVEKIVPVVADAPPEAIIVHTYMSDSKALDSNYITLSTATPYPLRL